MLLRLVDLTSEEEIVKYTHVNIEGCEILDARSLNRKQTEEGNVSYTPTGSHCVTFLGTLITKEIEICGLIFKLYPFILPVI